MNKDVFSDKKYTKAYYNSSSVAYELQPEYYPEQENENPLRKVRKKPLKKESTSDLFVKIKLILAVCVVFSGSIVTMCSYASVAQQKVALNRMKDNLNVLKNENNTLSSEISSQLSLDFIEQEATVRLNMAEPQPYQIEYIDVPKQSYTVHYETEKHEFNIKDFKEFFNFFKKG